jgi:hypothetical protein
VAEDLPAGAMEQVDNAVTDLLTGDYSRVCFPSGKLSAVTKKKNELQVLMSRVPKVTAQEINKEYAVYCDRVDSLQTACELELDKDNVNPDDVASLIERRSKINNDVGVFRDQVHHWLQGILVQHISVDVEDARSIDGNKSVRSNSSCSSVLSLRAKLAEQRAKRMAEESFVKQKDILTLQKVELEQKMNQLELKKIKDIERNLKEEIDALENCSEAGSQRSLSPCSKTARNSKLTPALTLEPNLFSDILNRQNEVSLLIARNQEKLLLPKNEPKVFDGTDLTQFKTFMMAFNVTIDARCDSSADKLYYLEKYTDAGPRELVRSCYGIDPDIAYRSALDQLNKHYGNEYKIADSYLVKIEKWPQIKDEDGKSFQDLSIYLTTCFNNMNSFASLNQLNSPKEIMNIVRKLPYKYREKWRSWAYKVSCKYRQVIFKDLVDFIEQQSTIINMPVFSDIRDEPNSRTCPPKGKILSTKVAEDCGIQHANHESIKKHCTYCQMVNHNLDNCKFFTQKTRDDKIVFLKENKLCFACLVAGHISAGCTERLTCYKCKRKHPTCLHNDDYRPAANVQQNSRGNWIQENKRALSSVCDTDNLMSMKTSCAVIPVKLKINGMPNTVVTYMALDTYSSDCFLDESLLHKLGVTGQRRDITLTTMEKVKNKYPIQVINNLEIYDLDENEMKTVPIVFSTSKWPFTSEDSPNPADVEHLPYLQDVPFRYVNCKIGLLIGANMPGILKPLKIVDRGDDEAYASLHRHGWALNGPLNSSTKNKRSHRIKVDNYMDLNTKIKGFFAQDFVDYYEDEPGLSIEDRTWEKKVSASFKRREDGHVEIALPFRKDYVTFPNNKVQALSRLQGTKSKLTKNENYRKEYNAFMQTMINEGFAELVPENELKLNNGKIWYLVHHGVRHPRKGKIRVVFDCALKYKGTSLNDELLQGPDLTNNLFGILLRFRQHGVGITADIEKMFYQVKVAPSDVNFMRFLWFPNCDFSKPPVEYRLNVHVFGATSSPSCSNFALKSTTEFIDHSKYSEHAIRAIDKSFYVDDLVISARNENHAKTLVSEIESIVAKGKFNLTSYASNSTLLLKDIPLDKVSKKSCYTNSVASSGILERALGVKWDVESDTLGIYINIPNNPITRRGVLSSTFSIYDPYGLVSPVVLLGKRIFQLACHLNLNWDAELPSGLQREWLSWLGGVQLLSNFTVPRCVVPTEAAACIELHLFSDGSEVGYGVAAYVRVLYSNNVHSTLLTAKSRLVPLSGTSLCTIPRIELCAAHLAVKLFLIIRREFQIKFDSVFFWTDSTTVLKYLRNDKLRFQRFVANKISVIRNHSDPSQWRYVPSKKNPADLASRGTTADNLNKSELWKEGPEFLGYDKALWPKDPSLPDLSDTDAEVKLLTKVLATVSNICPTTKLMESCSNWNKLKRRIAWMIRLKSVLHYKCTVTGNLTVLELENAETCIVKYVQSTCFSDVISSLAKRKCLNKKNVLSKLNPFVDGDGILRVGGRISRAKTSYDIKHPIILPKNCNVSELLVTNFHEEVGHLGKNSVLSALRNRYWIIGASVIAKRVCRQCIGCRKRHGRVNTQIMADLPYDRLNSDGVFATVGIDCFGPFHVIRGRSTIKRYGLIFTCLTSRAIHIEMLFSLTADSFLCALSRFMARRGSVKIIRSDNGTNFVGAYNELKSLLNSWNKHCEPWLTQKGIQWTFHPPAASHFGGVWEREIRTIRNVLDALLNEQNLKLTDERLNTLLCEVENILNNRPITELSDDPNDLEPLTPNHLLLRKGGITYPPGLFSERDLYANKKWKQVQYLSDLFWSRWRKEYLPLLQSRQKWRRDSTPLNVGDLVLLVDQLLPRNQWAMGRIVEVIRDRRGNVRSAKVLVAKMKGIDKLKTCNVDRVVVERPVVKLILLKSIYELG